MMSLLFLLALLLETTVLKRGVGATSVLNASFLPYLAPSASRYDVLYRAMHMPAAVI